ncbi:MAG: hypothetical protein ACOH2B_05660 [Burkholderiaceae bacterium]
MEQHTGSFSHIDVEVIPVIVAFSVIGELHGYSQPWSPRPSKSGPAHEF